MPCEGVTTYYFSAGVTSSAGTPGVGTIVFSDNGVALATTTVDAWGYAYFDTSALGSGNQSITASFIPADASFLASASTPLVLS